MSLICIGNNGEQWFDFDGHQIRFVLEDGEPWIVARDIGDALGMTQQALSAAVKQLDEDEVGTRVFCTKAGAREFAVITESGMYQIIMRSNKPAGKKLRKTAAMALKELRRKGFVAIPGKEPSRKELAQWVIQLEEEREQLESQKGVLESKIRADQPATNYGRRFISSHIDKISSTTVAKQLGFSSGQKLHKYLNDLKILFYEPREKLWRPYADYEWLIPEYCFYSPKEAWDGQPMGGIWLYWTKKGLVWLNEIINGPDAKPVKANAIQRLSQNA